MATNDDLRQYVIYWNPRDHPDQFVVRGWSITSDSEPIPDREALVIAPTLAEARAVVPPGLYRLPRFLLDDVAILEVWV